MARADQVHEGGDPAALAADPAVAERLQVGVGTHAGQLLAEKERGRGRRPMDGSIGDIGTAVTVDGPATTGRDRLDVGFGLALWPFDERRKRGGLARGELGEALAIERDAGRLEPVHQHAVGHAVLARGGVDADDPQAAVVALLPLAADVGVDARLLGRLLHELVKLALVLEVALGELGELLALGATDDSTLDARHDCSLRRSGAIDVDLARAHGSADGLASTAERP